MFQDQLTRQERIRLESLNQAKELTVLVHQGSRPTMNDVLNYAEQIEIWLKKAGLNA